MKQIISTDKAPQAIGTYSQAVKVGNMVYFSGQIALLPESMQMISDNIEDQIHQVFKNIQAVTEAAGASLENIAKLNIYLVDLSNFPILNDIMGQYFKAPYPARAAVEVSALPKAALVEMDGCFVV